MALTEVSPDTDLTTKKRLDTGWLFGGAITLPGIEDHLDPEVVRRYSEPELDDSSWTEVTLPHTVVPLSWHLWEPRTWEKVWVYRTHLDIAVDYPGQRLFVDFDGAMTSATVSLNGVVLGVHRGGYLPFSFEITDHLAATGDNILTVVLDSRFNQNVPPNLPAPASTSSIDYLQPGGLHRDVWLRSVPASFVSAIATTHFDVLDAERRRSSFVVTVDSASPVSAATITVELADKDGVVISSNSSAVAELAAGATDITVELTELSDVALWDVDAPTLYFVRATLTSEGTNLHTESLRTGYREAIFEKDGFYLNGARRYIMGVNRHGYYPFAGFAMPDRVNRRDARIIKEELNCIMVRCSHYPQTAAFLDACDELGLLAWEEAPGWQYVGDSEWQDGAVEAIEEMIARDRHRPSIVLWGARINETPDRPEFYARTEALIKSLDATRQTSGTMHGDYSRSAVFQHDVFGFDDYDTVIGADGERRPNLLPPTDDRPYLLTEAISTRSSPSTLYRRTEPASIQQHQALDYAHANDDAMADHRYTGLLAWVGFDYQANMGNYYRGVKTSGLGDVFRIPKPGAAIYRAQISPADRVVIEPAFTWDPPEFGQANAFGNRPEGRQWGPGAKAMICSNCDYLEVFLGEKSLGRVYPDRERFAHLPYAPSFVDLTLPESGSVDVRIDGYVGGELVGSKQMAGDRASDVIELRADDDELIADGVDATRVTVMIVDKFGTPRGSSRARIRFSIEGPATVIGDNPFDLEETGAVGAVWVRTNALAAGAIRLHAYTPEFGRESVLITSERPETSISINPER